MTTSPALYKAELQPTLVAALISAAVAMALYALTIAPTFSWGDSADLAMRLVYDGDQTFVGTHRDYALWRFFGQAAQWIPISDAGARANLFTAFWGAITVGAVAAIVQVTSRSTVAALAAAGSLMVAHTFWLLSVIAEVYTFNAAMVFLTFALAAIWWEDQRRVWLYPIAVFAGLSLAHHPTGLVVVVSLLPLLLVRSSRIDWLTASLSILIFFIISIDYWSAVAQRMSAGVGILSVLGLTMTQNKFFDVSIPRELLKFIAYLTFNFLGIGLFLGVLGIAETLYQKRWAVFPLMLWAVAFIYAGVTSSIPDKFNVYVMVYPSFAVLVGLGAVWLFRRFSLGLCGQLIMVMLLLAAPPVGYVAAVKASAMLNIDLTGARKAPKRENSVYFLWPPKNGDYGPRVFAQTALSDLPKRSILIADYTLWRPLYFVQAVDSLRPDIEIVFVERLLAQGVDNWIANQSCDRRVFLATKEPARYYQLDRIENRFRITQVGTVYEVERECPRN